MKPSYLITTLCGLCLNIATLTCHAGWPAEGKTAVSLAYDDALASQLDNAVPALNHWGFKGSFYLVMSSPAIASRMEDWKQLAVQGHELGNHTLFHPCRGSLAHREWVEPGNDLDTRSVQQMLAEVTTANAFLQALDGKSLRTFTPPCFDTLASQRNYLPAIANQFISIKANDPRLEKRAVWLMPSDIDGAGLIALLQKHTQPGKLIGFTFHGIGADHLAVSTAAHSALLTYLAEHKDTYYVDSYINIVNTLTATEK